MAAIGKIRSWGPILVTIIGLALFAFIAEELFRSCDSLRNQERQQVGKVLGQKIDVQEFQALVDEYADVIKMTQGRENLTDEELNQVKDMVWNQYVQNAVIEDEAEKLGLTVTDQELQNILQQGTNPVLMQTPFVNQQTGRFDVNLLKKFLAEYKTAQQSNPQIAEQYKSVYNFWTFVEKNLRQQTLVQKYQGLLGACMLSNPVSAKMAYTDENTESSITLAAFPYSAINDNKVTVSDADLKAKYEELKPRFKQPEETRDIKFVDVQVTASKTDLAALHKSINDFTAQLSAAADPTEVVRKSASLIAYLGIPQTKAAFPSDIAARLDSMAVGATSAAVENKADNTMNVVKLVAKQQLPDSIQFRAIQVLGADAAAARKTADSIYTALQAGADFEAIAKKYGQTGQKNWITSSQYQNAPSMDSDTRKYIETLNTSSVNTMVNLAMTSGHLILQVTDRKAMVEKYTAAVIKKPIEFTKDTYSAAYNKFSQYVSMCKTMDDLKKNASKFGYQVQERQGVRTAEHYIAGVRSTREAMKWLFAAKEGEISPLYECGDNDHLLVLALDRINAKGYISMENEQLKEYLKAEVLKDKKAEQIEANIKGVKTIADANRKGGKILDINQITFAAPVFVQVTGASEPALSGAVAGLQKGKFCAKPVKGNAGVYLFQVKDKAARGTKYDAKKYEAQLRQKYLQFASNFMQELMLKAGVMDNRYLFF
ncbi:MAG: SurA N-terminal domain-containing protein [Prevotellaceae bacterium]|nr:SurA N-terminal domain-containing protein [Prevotellaceae bacterium]MDY6130339.1 peptidylprolyl isomerase [Prevotella sp.]